ncbi:AT-rich interactive domain-containing protein 5B, partial [Papilio machaon]
DEVLAINDKVVVRAEDLLSWVSEGSGWRWGLRAVWRGACAPPADPSVTAPLHHTKLDFSDVEREKSAISIDEDSPGVMVFSYPRYCRYRALLARLDGIQADWLRDSLVAALGGYAAPTKNTRILYCKETFEYPELEGHEFVCNHLAPRLKGRPRGRRRRARSRSASRSDSDDPDAVMPREHPLKSQLLTNFCTINMGAKRKSVYIKDKILLIRLLEAGERRPDVGKRFGFSRSTVATIWKNRVKLLKAENDGKTKTLKTPLYGVLDRAMLSWYSKQHKVSSAIIKDKAKEIAKDKGLTNFKASEGWLRKFKQRYQIKRKIKGDKSVNKKVISLQPTPRRLSLRNGGLERRSDEESEGQGEGQSQEDKEFLQELSKFHKERNEDFNTMKHLCLRSLYKGVSMRGGYEAVCRARLWRALSPDQPARARRHYERFLLPFENHERKNGSKFQKINGHNEPKDTIEVKDSPLREIDSIKDREEREQRLRTPSPKKDKVLLDNETGEVVKTEDLNVTSKPAEELNREFLDSLKEELPKEDKSCMKISVKPVEKLRDTEENRDAMYLNELTQKFSLASADAVLLQQLAADRKMLNGHPPNPPTQQPPTSSPQHVQPQTTHTTQPDQRSGRPLGRSSLRAVRVKPTRPPPPPPTTPSVPPLGADSASSPQPALNNFGIHHPHTPPAATTTVNNNTTATATTVTTVTTASNSDDEIVEVPYKPKTPEIIDLDEYPESPQEIKKKKLDILKERGLEVTAVPPAPPTAPPAPPAWPLAPHLPPLAPLVLNPAMQHQIMTQAQLFHMYNILPPHLPNGVQPPKVIQGTGIFGSSGPEKTVYGNPKDPFMPPPHVLHGVPVRPQRAIQSPPPPHHVLDLTCKLTPQTPHKPAVEIVRVPTSPPKPPTPQNLSKNYTLIDGKAVVGSNLEITLCLRIKKKRLLLDNKVWKDGDSLISIVLATNKSGY